MENQPIFVSYKKVVIFGSESSGKTALTKRLERGSFMNVSPIDEDEGKK